MIKAIAGGSAVGIVIFFLLGLTNINDAYISANSFLSAFAAFIYLWPRDKAVFDQVIPKEVENHFWKIYSHRIPSKAIVMASMKEVDPKDITTAMGNHIIVDGKSPERSYLFFIDFNPEANWAHNCAYIFVSRKGKTIWCSAEWPPHISITLKCLKNRGNI